MLVAAFIIEVIQYGYSEFVNITAIKDNFAELSEHYSYESDLNAIGFLASSWVWLIGVACVITLLIISCVKLIRNANIHLIITVVFIILLICAFVDIVVGTIYLINNELDLYCDYGKSYRIF